MTPDLGRHHQQRLARCRRDRLRTHAPRVQLLLPRSAWVDESRAVTDRPVVSAGSVRDEPQPARLHRRRRDTARCRRRRRRSSRSSPHRPTPPTPLSPAARGEGENRTRTCSARFPSAKSPVPSIARGSAIGATDYRGGESTLGNLVAEVQQWATEQPESGAAEIAFMNPGGLRADMVGTDPGDGSFPRTLTYGRPPSCSPSPTPW